MISQVKGIIFVLVSCPFPIWGRIQLVALLAAAEEGASLPRKQHCPCEATAEQVGAA